MRKQHLLITCTAVFLALLAYASSLVLLAPAPAQASAYVIGSNPIDGSTIDKVPQSVQIFFNAPISSLSQAHAFVVQQGALVDISNGTGQVSPTDPREFILTLNPPTQSQGSYLIRWMAIDRDDARETFGAIGFNVIASSNGLPGTTILGPSTSNDLDAIRALDTEHISNIFMVVWECFMLIALMFWFGILFMEQFVLAERGHCTEILHLIRKSSTSLQWLCLSTFLFSNIVLLYLRATFIVETTSDHQFFPTLQAILFQTSYGILWLVRLVLILLAIALLFSSTRRQQPADAPDVQPTPTTSTVPAPTNPQPSSQPLDVVPTTLTTPTTPAIALEQRHPLLWPFLAGLILLTFVLTRAPAQIFQPPISAILLDWLNLAATAIWFGSFAYLGILILPLFKHKELVYHPETLYTIMRRLLPIILPAIGVQFVSTIFLTESAISQPQQFLTDPYGRTLLIQLILLFIQLILSLYALLWQSTILKNQLHLLSLASARSSAHQFMQEEIQRTEKSLRPLFLMIAIIGVSILTCSALLTFFDPPIHFPDTLIGASNAASAQQNATPVPQTQQLGDLAVTLQILPGQSGVKNTVTLNITDQTGHPVTNATVQLTTNMQIMDMGTAHVTLSAGTPAYTTIFDQPSAFNMSGVWLITVSIQQPGHSPQQGTFHITIT